MLRERYLFCYRNNDGVHWNFKRRDKVSPNGYFFSMHESFVKDYIEQYGKDIKSFEEESAFIIPYRVYGQKFKRYRITEVLVLRRNGDVSVRTLCTIKGRDGVPRFEYIQKTTGRDDSNWVQKVIPLDLRIVADLMYHANYRESILFSK